jgi:hypothetical protein
MPCTCRHHEHPTPIDIAPGLQRLPRMVASYGAFRRAMLGDASAHSELDAWVAREPGDLGVLLVELWALACGIVAFADETICHECYLRTARLDGSLRRLVGLLGYRPRPAVAATADVSFRVTGRNPVTVPVGTALRSGAVGEHPPQVFELAEELVAHALANGFDVVPGPDDEIAESSPGTGVATFGELTVLVEAPGLVSGSPVLVWTPDDTVVQQVTRVTRLRGPGPQRVVLRLATPVSLAAGTRWEDVTVATPTLTAGLWTLVVTGFTQSAISTTGGITSLTLSSLQRLYAVGDAVVLQRGDRFRWFTVTSVQETTYRVAPDVAYSFDDDDYTLPGASTVVTRLVLDASINSAGHRDPGDTESWGEAQAAEITVRGGWVTAGTFESPIATTLADAADPLDVGTDLDAPWSEHQPDRFTVVDRDGRAVTAAGAIDWPSGEVSLEEVEAWVPPLRFPVRLDGNVGLATRGETVLGEVLGSGDAALTNQVFTLAKSPLTYLGPSASTGDEVATSTLTVWVNGIRWDEVPHFVGPGPADRVYVVRHTDDHGTEVVFGDGVRGSRLPTGQDNVVADYRHGAGAIHPPAASIAQLVRPVDGLAGVVNRAAAYGGSDAAGPEELRADAPRSALMLGRIVSREDAAAAARETPGVVTAVAWYAWNPDRLASGIVVRYIGDPGLAEGLRGRLRALAECDVRVDALVSPAQAVAVTVTLVPDPRRRADDVAAAVRAALTGEGGVLTPAVLGIDGPLFRSRLAAAVVGTDGVQAVTGLLLDGAVFDQVGVAPPEGWYLDAVTGLTVVLEEETS